MSNPISLQNPGYEAPRGVRVSFASGVVIDADVKFVDVVLDKGAPTPRFEVVLPDDMDLSLYKVQSMEATFWPPGTILMFPQAGNAAENAERIVELSRRKAYDKLMMSRKDRDG